MFAKIKLNETDEAPHKQWSMWLNSIQSGESYQGLKCCESSSKRGVPLGTHIYVVHDYRQVMM